MTPSENVWKDCPILQTNLCFVPAVCPFWKQHLSYYLPPPSSEIFFFLFFSNSCFFSWGLECCLFGLMCVTGVGNWNEGWLHANESSPLSPCFTHSSSKWLMEWPEGRAARMGETVLCCCQDSVRAAGKLPPIFTSLCSASNFYWVLLPSL